MRAITDSTGTVVERYDYDAFGALRNTPTGVANDRRFTSEQHDAETAYTYLRARYYDPALGRFISKDPLRGSKNNPQTLNRYIYTANNPVNRADRSGKFSMDTGCSALDEGWNCGGGGNPIIPVVVGGLTYYYDEITGAVINVIDSGLDALGTLLSSGSIPWMPEHTRKHLENRGWAPGEAENVIANPARTEARWDNRKTPPEPATRYYDANDNSVTVNDNDGEIIQVSKKGDPNWHDDDNMTPRQ